MNTVMTKEELERILDQALRDVTEQTAGVRLHQGEQPPGEDFCTVNITFVRIPACLCVWPATLSMRIR